MFQMQAEVIMYSHFKYSKVSFVWIIKQHVSVKEIQTTVGQLDKSNKLPRVGPAKPPYVVTRLGTTIYSRNQDNMVEKIAASLSLKVLKIQGVLTQAYWGKTQFLVKNYNF